MIAPLLLLLAQASPTRPAPAVRPVASAAPMPPADWSTLSEVHFRRRADLAAGFSDYVRDEVRAGRCAAVRAPDGRMSVHVDLAVLVAMGGVVRRIVPRAMNCATVEQYATGLVERMSRDNLDMSGADVDAWYRTGLDFTWRE